MKTINYIAICLMAISLICCNEKVSENRNEVEITIAANSINNDSIELTNLTKQVYEWHATNGLDDFPYEIDKLQDSIFIGIDWDKYHRNIELFKKTSFFTRDFLLKHKRIALSLDSSIRRADITWRNIRDGIPLWNTNADDWCNCQDNPDEYWKIITIDSLKANNVHAEFVWTWEKELAPGSFTYKMTAKKEEGKWKINSIDGFNYYYSAAHYDKLMKDN